MLYLNIGHSEFQLMPSNRYVASSFCLTGNKGYLLASSVCLTGNKGINHKKIPQSSVWVT